VVFFLDDLEVDIPTGHVLGWQTVHVGRIFVEIGRIGGVPDLGNDGRRQSARPQAFPVEAVEPAVLLDVADFAFLVAEALRRVVAAVKKKN